MSGPMYDVVFERNVMVPMRDGVRLATDIYWPARGGRRVEEPFPVLLERTPYHKLRTDLVRSAKFFAAHGYVVVLQDVRGRFDSEGEWYPFKYEGPDGYDTIAWIHRQPWCNGQVATIGLSYSACTQTSAAVLNPPGLAAQFVSQGYHNYHDASMRQGGALELRFFIYAFRMAASSKEALSDPVKKAALWKAHQEVTKYLAHTPLKPGVTPLRLVPSYERWVLDISRHGEYSPYWSESEAYSITERYDDHADVPVYFLGSWYDTYARSTTQNFVELSKRKKGPFRLIMGPWIHGAANLERSYAGDVDFGPDAAIDYDLLRLRWFDAVLKGVDNGILDEPPVKIFVMGGGSGRRTPDGKLDHGGRWRYEHEWPLSRAREQKLYLRHEGLLLPEPPTEDDPPSRFTYDPRNPVPTIGGNISAVEHVMPGGGFDQRGRPDVYGARDDLPLSVRRDVLVFTTPPLEEDVEVTGTIQVRLWVSSSAPDTDFTAKILDIYPPNEDYPDGYELNIADSIIRMRYRNSVDQPELMEPGQVYEATITLYPTSNLFKKGHRIGLHISSSNYPRFDLNPNTGGPLGVMQGMQSAQQTVYHDRARPSHVVLPVIPRSGDDQIASGEDDGR